MKKILFLLLISSSIFFGQNNDNKTIVLSKKLTIFKDDNKYGLADLLKTYFSSKGYKVYFQEDGLPEFYAANACTYLLAYLKEDNNFLQTKIAIEVQTCTKEIVASSNFEASKEKDLKMAHKIVLRKAFESLDFKKLDDYFSKKNNVKTTNNANSVAQILPQKKEEVKEFTLEQFFAIPINNGYKIVNSEPKLLFYLYNTSQKEVYLYKSDTKNGVVVKIEGYWVLEYEENEIVKQEILNIKF